MINVEGLRSLQKIPWEQIRPGQIVLGGISVNGGLPSELLRFPILTPVLIQALHQKYNFLNKKFVLVAQADSAFQSQIGDKLKDAKEKITYLNEWRSRYFDERHKLNEKNHIHTDIPFNEQVTEKPFLKQDRYNSFDLVFPEKDQEIKLPSLFHRKDLKIQFSDVLTGQVREKFLLPQDKPLDLHIGVDYSYSVNNNKKLDYLILAVNNLCELIAQVFLKTNLKTYVFSDTCSEVKAPLSGKEIEKRNTCYDAFFKKVLSNRRADVRNKILLLSDGEPGDLEETLQRAAILKKLKIDYTQIILSLNNEDAGIISVEDEANILDGVFTGKEDINTKYLTGSELQEWRDKKYQTFTRIADIANGNQIIANIHEYLGLLSIETYDRYMGALSYLN